MGLAKKVVVGVIVNNLQLVVDSNLPALFRLISFAAFY
jgi:hypothetical protein